jgi:phosphoribosylaminoimidazolecarboxamide formyltransferase/IMP cyclohydrolase
LQEELSSQDGATSLSFRKDCAAKAFALTAAYDSAISRWFAKEQNDIFPQTLTLSATLQQPLRYGENPHQKAAFYCTDNTTGLAGASQLQGKELSYNNINDTDAALQMVMDFADPAAVIVKHANPCGIAIGTDSHDAFVKALACDPVSAFGGIIAFNRPIDKTLAELISGMFVEVIVAPHILPDAKAIFTSKKNLRVLEVPSLLTPSSSTLQYKSVMGGLLVQDLDLGSITEKDIEVVTKRAPSKTEMRDLLFAFAVCKHVKSNAIVFAKDGATIGIGAGQMSRVDAVRIARMKASDDKAHPDRAKGSVVASDAFFPFADGLLEAASSGITAAIQPGGSVRDKEVIAAADEHNIAMVFTGTRHFKH